MSQHRFSVTAFQSLATTQSGESTQSGPKDPVSEASNGCWMQISIITQTWHLQGDCCQQQYALLCLLASRSPWFAWADPTVQALLLALPALDSTKASRNPQASRPYQPSYELFGPCFVLWPGNVVAGNYNIQHAAFKLRPTIKLRPGRPPDPSLFVLVLKSLDLHLLQDISSCRDRNETEVLGGLQAITFELAGLCCVLALMCWSCTHALVTTHRGREAKSTNTSPARP